MIYVWHSAKISSLFTFPSKSPVFIGIPGGEESSATLHPLFTPPTSLFIGIPEGLVKSEEYFRVCFHIIFIGQDYDMTTLLYQD
jgi:hypothetical protein